MRITSISITNMAKFENFTVSLPAVALIQGKNGEGKTSFLDVIKYCFGRGHDDSMLRVGASAGETFITFDDESQIKVRITPNETKRGYKAPGARKFLVSREQIDAIANAIGYDPLRFMDMSDKEQVETILKIMPISAEVSEIETAVGEAGPEASAAVPLIGKNMNAFDVIRVTEGAIYEARRVLNVAADTQAKHASELQEALAVPESREDWSVQESRLRWQKERDEKALAERIGDINNRFAAFRMAQDEWIKTETERLRSERDAAIETERTACAALADQAREEYQPLIDESTAALATATERARVQQQSIGTLKAIEVARAEATAKQSRSKILTESLTRLSDLKFAIAARLPIPGILIEDCILDAKRIPFSRWNTERQLRFCLRIGVLAHGTAGFICLDGAERFDPEKRKALLKTASKYAEEDGLQFIIASVSEGSLEVLDGGKG